MALHIKILILFILLLFNGGTLIACSSSDAVDPSSDPPQKDAPSQEEFQNAFEINQILGRGINLGNALEAPSEGDWGMVIEEQFIDLIQKAGFQSVRIPVRWNANAGNSHPYAINVSFFNRVDEIIQWSLDRGLAVMLNIHHYNELMQHPQQHRERFLKIWDQIATHYKDYPEQLVFEILNEPHDNLTPVLWNTYLKEAIKVVRQTNPRRVIVIGTANWGGFGTLPQLELPSHDRQIIATVHYYNPFQFTHQGASWAGPDTDDWLGTTWDGTSEEFNEVNRDFDSVSAWAQTNNRPVHLGEFGAFSTADEDSRQRWTAAIREAAENRGFSWAYWEFGAGFGIYDRNLDQWHKHLLEALIPESPELRD